MPIDIGLFLVGYLASILVIAALTQHGRIPTWARPGLTVWCQPAIGTIQLALHARRLRP